jgi:phosphate transport system substrate-binding protein
MLFHLFGFLLFMPAITRGQNMITGSGCSVSVPGYLTDLARDYEKETGVRIVLLGGGSSRGLADLKEGRVDFAAACMKSPDDADDFEYITAAWDALAFIAHPSNSATSLTPRQIREIYQGRIINWKQLGGPDRDLRYIITMYEAVGGVTETLRTKVLDGERPVQGRNSIMQASSAAIWEQLVEKTPEAFATSGFTSARKRNVKLLRVNGVAPTKENIISGKYPFRRPLYLVIKRNSKPEVRKFADFVLSRKGQALISSYGIPSLADIK